MPRYELSLITRALNNVSIIQYLEPFCSFVSPPPLDMFKAGAYYDTSLHYFRKDWLLFYEEWQLLSLRKEVSCARWRI